MRTTMLFVVTGKSKTEIEERAKLTIAKYFEVEDVDSILAPSDIDLSITVAEEERGNFTYAAQCSVRAKS
jgi:hypothetical protein